MTTVQFYDKDQVDSLLGGKADTTDLPSSSELVPDTTGASQGDVLTVGASGAEWATPSGSGVTRTVITNWTDFTTIINRMKTGDKIIGQSMGSSSSNSNKITNFELTKLSLSTPTFVGSAANVAGGARIIDNCYLAGSFFTINYLTSYGTASYSALNMSSNNCYFDAVTAIEYT